MKTNNTTRALMAMAIMLAASTTANAQLGSLIRKATNTVSNVSGTVSEIEYSVGQVNHVAGKVKEVKDAVTPNNDADGQSANAQQAPAAKGNQQMRIKTDASGQKTWHFGSKAPAAATAEPASTPARPVTTTPVATQRPVTTTSVPAATKSQTVSSSSSSSQQQKDMDLYYNGRRIYRLLQTVYKASG